MKKYSVLVGGLTFLVLMIGAFLVPVQAANAAPATTYNRFLPGRTLVDRVSTITTSYAFRTNRRGVLSLRTIQNANLGIDGPGARYSGGFAALTIVVTLDAATIYTVTKSTSARFNDPSGRTLTPVGIFVTQSIAIGRHTLSMGYTSSYVGLSAVCSTPGHALCPGARIYPGRAILVTPNRF